MPRGVRVETPLASDPAGTAARLVIEFDDARTLAVRLTPRACAKLAARLLELAGREAMATVEDGFRPLVDMAIDLNYLLGGKDGD